MGAHSFLPQTRWRYMDCSAVASMGSTEVPMSKNWVHQSLSRQVNVAFSAMPASLNVFTEREVLDVFIPLPCLGDGWVSPPEIDMFGPTYDKPCLPDIRVWKKSPCAYFCRLRSRRKFTSWSL